MIGNVDRSKYERLVGGRDGRECFGVRERMILGHGSNLFARSSLYLLVVHILPFCICSIFLGNQF